ncbi:MAG TPA: hypothetical protein VFO16_09965 [Pseudonocardiaceae bacterium]|nr:hypothetical protein [Pseudonocardiaceae bacterium]
MVDQGAQLLGQPGTVLLEAARGVLLPAQRQQPVPLGGRDTAGAEERRDVDLAYGAFAGQQHRHVARRHIEHLSDPLAVQPRPLHDLAQSFPQLAAAHRRLAMWHDDTSQHKIIDLAIAKFDESGHINQWLISCVTAG